MDGHQDRPAYRITSQAADTQPGAPHGIASPAARLFNTARREIARAPYIQPQTEEATVGDYFALLKPRVMSLVVFTGLTGMMMAPGAINPVIGFIALLCIAIGAGASGALNMWYDADIDQQMERTKTRPIPMGRVAPAEALNLGVTLSLGSILLMGIAVNAVSAALLALTIGFYMFIYTMWLKRRTPQNIVIGGAAGAFPPMIGWAAVTGTVSVESIVLFMIIFMWTPPHFWALALYRSQEYAKVGVPMLPVVAGRLETCKQILIYTALMIPVTLAPWLMGFASIYYGVSAAVLGLIFAVFALRVWQSRNLSGDNADRPARHLFAYSILYLMLLFTALLAEGLLNMGSGA
ncbi:MAG: heme o synthase [Alphaproteobacteria bacterium]|nr:heme o synthase [Alphaproteobacteria bacterium]